MIGNEIDLLRNYPRTNRDVSKRLETKSAKHRSVARQFGKEFFDGSRDTGYGGFHYNERFWQPVMPDFRAHFDLTANSSLLDVGCAKGFMLVDLKKTIPGINLRGIDISEYAIDNAHPDVADIVSVGRCDDLPFEDDSFEVVVSITTIHNLGYDGCVRSLKEIERVSKKRSFITVDAYRDDEERKRMEAWNLTAKTILHVDEWREMFDKAGYTGDFYWFMP
jgi:ubiquinone/menaquinone biosynthesis C-methylase UbiE